jgi:peptide/nickel transport system permease protein
MDVYGRIRSWRKEHYSWFKELRYMLYLVKKSPLTMVGFMLFVSYIILATFGAFLAEGFIYGIDLQNRLAPPSFAHPFGSDDMGRDIFCRVIYGFRISLFIGVVVVSCGMILGSFLGLFAGYYKAAGEIIMRITDVFLAFPSIVLALAITAALGRSLTNTVLAISLTWWPWYTRLVYSQVLSIKENLYVESARAIGASDLRIIFRHILPNCMAPVIVNASLDFGYAILLAAGLGFLGIGAQPPDPEWGLMVSQGSNYIMNNWWMAAFPGLAIAITILGWNLLGDGLRDILDPRLRRR